VLEFFGGLGAGVVLGAGLMAYGLATAAAEIVREMARLLEEQRRQEAVDRLIAMSYDDDDEWRRS
jgi:hypothetical protein